MKKPKKDNPERAFRSIRSGMECVFFMKSRSPIEPISFVEKICEGALKPVNLRERKCRYLNRLTPVTFMDKSSEHGIERVARKVLPRWFDLVANGNADGNTETLGTESEEERQPFTVSVSVEM
jgi:tRNA acetyltransferase TAN1